MKRIQWPSSVRVEFDKEVGKKLDSICKETHVNRPSAIKQAVVLLWQRIQSDKQP